ncbi:redoxin domain-containing protein [Ectobacillus polymachus]|uniref:redoxin domain-containing protein n=1 Tax=Ectobacillus polymachus TaxID=1508806 RepID=UPI003A8813CC
MKYLISSLIISIVLYFFGTKALKIERKIMDLLFNSLLYGLLIWKFSYVILHPQTVFNNPIRILFFNGGTAGIGIATAFVIIYSWLGIKKANISFRSYIIAIIPVYLGFVSTFLLVHVSEDVKNIILLLQAIVSIAFFIAASRIKTELGLIKLLIWFHLLEFELALSKHQYSYAGLVSPEVLFYGLLIVISLFALYWLKRENEVDQKAYRKTNNLVIGIILASFVIVSFLSSGQGTENMQASTPATAVAIGLNKGQASPDFELPSISGKKMKLSDFRGKVVILNFWATWCPPCKAEIPEFVKFYEMKKNENVEIVGVNLTKSESNPGSVMDFVKNNSMTFPILLDEKGEIGQLYQMMTIPTSYIIDKNGVIQDKYVGAMSYEMMNNFVSKIQN